MNLFKYSEVCNCGKKNLHIFPFSLIFFSVLKGTEALMLIVFQAISPLHIPVCVCESAPTHIRQYVKLEQSKNAISWGRRLNYMREQSLIRESAQAHKHLSNKLAGLVGSTSLMRLAIAE